jgi:hypothetical protein
MNSHHTTILRFVAILLLLMQPGLASVPQSGARPTDETIAPLQDHLSSSNPQQEKRSKDTPVQKIENIFGLALPEPSTPIRRMRPLIAKAIPKFASLLVYTQTTSTFL